MDNTYLFIKILSLLIGVGALNKIPVGDRSKWLMYVYSCIYILSGIATLNSSYLFVLLIGGILLGLIIAKLCNILQPKLDTHEALYFQKEMTRVNTVYGMSVIKNQQLTQVLMNLDKKYGETNSDIRYLLGELSRVYSENNISGNYTKLCQVISKLIPLMNKPYVVYLERNPDMFSQLVTKRDYKKAIKALKEFREDNYLGEGFDKELAYYIELLEKGEKNAINRVQQTSK